ncbi:DNA pilot protein [Microviridae sp.]|nr:DNA pilot protein [Microviridae sp.]
MPIPAAVALAAPLVGQFFNSIIGRRASVKNTQATIQANKELAQYAYSKDLEQWNRSNQYNAPSEQMARLKEAGLNPNLVYGNGSVVGNTSGQQPKYNAPTVDYSGQLPVQLPDMLSAYQNFELKQAQIDNVKAQARLTQSEANVRQSTQVYQTEKIKHDSRLSQRKVDLAETQLSQKKLDIIFNKYRNEWAKSGFTKSDSVAFRMMIRMLQESGINFWNEDEINKIFKPK